MPEEIKVPVNEKSFNSSFRKMSSATRDLSKDLNDVFIKLKDLNKTKVVLNVDTHEAKRELHEIKTGYDSIGSVDSLKHTSNVIKKNGKHLKSPESIPHKLQDFYGKNEGEAVVDYVTQVASHAVTSGAKSAFGSAAGNIVSDVVPMVTSAVLAGGGLPGALIAGGAAVINGMIKNFEEKDNAFNGYIRNAYDTVKKEQAASTQNGSTIAASREQTRLHFEQLFGSDKAADEYMDKFKAIANHTNFNFDEVAVYFEDLISSYRPDQIAGIIATLSDASAGMNLSSADVSAFASGLSNMRSTENVTEDVLTEFNKYGVDVYQALSKAIGVEKDSIAEMIGKGKISGDTAAQAILDWVNVTYGDMSEKLSSTYLGKLNNLRDIKNDIDAEKGEAYNKERSKGVQAEIDYYDSDKGKTLKEGEAMMGTWEAHLENLKEQKIREALDAVMVEYQAAIDAGDELEAERIRIQAQIHGTNEYNASEDAQLQTESDKAIVNDIINDTSKNRNYWDYGYELGECLSKGIVSGFLSGKSEISFYTNPNNLMPENLTDGGDSTEPPFKTKAIYDTSWKDGGCFAYGLARVPYDGYPALLHEGERVLTASEARTAAGRGYSVQVTVTGNQFTVRSEADIDAIASRIAEKVSRAQMLDVPA